MILEPASLLWVAVKAHYDSWPPDNEDLAADLGVVLANLTTIATAAGATGTASARTVHDAWHDEAGDVMIDKLTHNAGQWSAIADKVQRLAKTADQYARDLISAKRVITDIIARNEAQYVKLLTDSRTTRFAAAFATQVADYLRWMVGDGKPPPQAGPSLADRILNGIENVGADLGNGIASLGNAMLHHPGDVVAAAGGLALASYGVGGEFGGIALDATGAGAVVGIPANIASAGMIAGGLAAATPAIGDVIFHATNDDSVQPFGNQMGDSLQGELDAADQLGVRPVSPGSSGFDEAVDSGTVKWAVREDGTLVVEPKYVQGEEISHSVLTRGEPVLAAGEAEIVGTSDSGYYGLEINGHSGHFQPSPESLQIGKDAFSAMGINFR